MQRHILYSRMKRINMRRFQDMLCSLRRFSQSELTEVGKEKIKPLLDKCCSENDLKII